MSTAPDDAVDQQRRAIQMHTLERVVTSLLSDGTHTEQELLERIQQFRPVAAPDLTDEEIETVARGLTQRLLIDVDLGVALTSADFVSWLPGKRQSIGWDRWLNYKAWLLRENRPPKVIDKMDELTDKILDLVGDPTVGGAWSRRGLVIGDVQSGKTSTYMALFNKAADAGFRLIIVLAGGTELLRQQTQQRVDEGFIGRDSRLTATRSGVNATPSRYIGVGQLDKSLAKANGMTTVMQDFRKTSQAATNISVSSDSPEPYVFVVKKNKSVLNALAMWLDQQPKSQGKLDIPVLLLDDESDYASVNTREDDNPTAINAAVRGVLDRFSRSSYLAFTATPFANIFIDHDNTNDLFPRDFVYSLEAPTNYVGSARTFGTADDSRSVSVIDLEDADDFFPAGHKSGHNIPGLPNSLNEAIRTFFVANAIRDLRGDDSARSMLINVSRFKNVQRQVFSWVESEVSRLRTAVDLHAKAYTQGTPNSTLDLLRETFQERYSHLEFEWPEVLGVLRNAVSSIRVELHNSDRDKKLAEEETAWDQPPRLIAVGGDVLSRGLTLGGLMTSYFYRRVAASDTLMQMARWFGYRDGYADLCRVWIDPGVAADYRFVDDSVEELRRDLALMEKQRLTPSDFGLAIKKHPGSLLVTARNKMKSASVDKKSVSLAGRRIETTKLTSRSSVLESNYHAFDALVRALQSDSLEPENRDDVLTVWRDVHKQVVAEFLKAFQADRSEALFTQPSLANFVSFAQAPHLQTWDVVVMNGKRAKNADRRVEGLQFWPPKRSATVGTDGTIRVSGKSSKLGGSDDLSALLPVEMRKEAEAEFWQTDTRGSKSVPESVFYSRLQRPALLIYPLNVELKPATDHPQGKERDEVVRIRSALAKHLAVAVKVAIPGSPVDSRDKSADVEYYINTVAQQNWLPEFGLDDNEDDLDG